MRKVRLSVIFLAIAALVVGLLAMRSYMRTVEERSKLVAPMGQIHEQEQMGASSKGKGGPALRMRARDKEEEIYKVPQPIELGE